MKQSSTERAPQAWPGEAAADQGPGRTQSRGRRTLHHAAVAFLFIDERRRQGAGVIPAGGLALRSPSRPWRAAHEALAIKTSNPALLPAHHR